MSEDRFVANPTLVIGLGGTGLKVATFVKKSLLEANRNQLPRRMAVLVLDTEQEIKFWAGGWGRERSGQHATGPVRVAGGEYVPLVGTVKSLGEEIKREQVQAATSSEIRRGQAHRHISSWFQALHYIDEAGIDPAVWNLDVGAGRFRQFGRLALFKNFTTVRQMLGGTLTAIHQMGATRIYVHITSSLAGGTGAALFMDVAHLVKQLAERAGFTQSPVIFGHFVLVEGFRGTPPVQLEVADAHEDFDARCYAALRELTRLQGTVTARTHGYPIVYDPAGTGEMNARLNEGPFTAVYLYDGARQNNPLNSLEIEEGLAPAIADAIVAYVDDKSAGAFCSHSVNYKSFYSAYKIPTGLVTYGSVGTYTIELPIYHITEGWAHDLAKEALDRLLEPEARDAETKVPVKLASGQPGGQARDPKDRAEAWLREDSTPLVGKLAEWGKAADQTSTLRQQAVDSILSLDALGWQQQLAPSDPAWQTFVAESQAELEGSLKDKKSDKYFVDPDQPGSSDEERANNLQQEVDGKLKQMVGESQDVWLRAGGSFRGALMRLGGHHVRSFDNALLRWLKVTLNGDPNVGTPVERKQGKLGYARAFLERVDAILKNSAAVLTQAEEQAKTKRRPTFDALDGGRKEIAAEMRKKGGPWGRNRKTYRDRSDELAQFHKADIARGVVYKLVELLQVSVEQALTQVKLWERILATAKAPAGGAYALIMDGKREVDVDRGKAKNAVRWVIEDNEPGDTYIADKRQQYSRGKLNEIMEAVEWRVGKTDGSGPMRIDFAMAGKAWDRIAGSEAEQARGVQNVASLLDKCRSAFAVAWSDMSVTAYLVQNYGQRIDELARRIYQKSGCALSLAGTPAEPPMRTTFMRVFKEGLDQPDFGFLRQLRTSVAQQFKESSTAQERAAAAQKDYVTDSGEDSRDRFKLTFIMFGDLLKSEQIAGFSGAQGSYHAVSSRGNNWKTLHVLPAETNALEIERSLSTGPQKTQQRRRELSEEVTVALEDADRFHLAMHCLAYGETDYDWQFEGERGMLLHKYTPPRVENPRGLSYWRLTVEPTGVQHGDGHLYTRTGQLAGPEHYQLTQMASEPDLLQAFIQFVCVGRSLKNNAEIEMDRVEATVQHMMDRHCHRLAEGKKLGWKPGDKEQRDRQLLEEGQDKASQTIRLNALLAWADEELEKYRWSWAEGATPPSKVTPEERISVQHYIDLWTAVRGTAKEEMDNLGERLAKLGTWQGRIPMERITLQSDVATKPEEDGETQAGEAGWICSHGHSNELDSPYCEECGEARPEAPVTQAISEPETPPAQVCEGGHEIPPGMKFCPECGKLPKKEELPQALVCENGHEMPLGVKFCPECGKPPKKEELAQVRVCENGHEMPPGVKFCPECGMPPKKEEPRVRVCENGHEMPPGVKFCPECGKPPAAQQLLAVRICQNGHEIPSPAKFCPECGAPPR